MARYRARFKEDLRMLSTRKNPAGVVGASLVTETAVIFESMLDFVTPWYKSRTAESALPMNLLEYDCLTRTEAPLSQTWRLNNGTFLYFDGNLTQFLTNGWLISWPTPTVPGYNPTSLSQAAQSDALKEMDNPEYAFAEPLATVGQTLRTIRQPLTSLRRTISRFWKKREDYRRRNVKLDAKQLADLWLSYSVNASPNLRTVDDAIDSFARRAVKKRYSDLQKATSTKKFVGAGYSSSTSVNDGWFNRRQQTRFISHDVKATIHYRSFDLNTKASYLGLRARDLPGLVWDLVPLSFMVDRLINVGRFLKVSSSLLSSKVRVIDACVSSRVQDSRTRRIVGLIASPGTGTVTPQDTNPWVVTTFTYDRVPWGPSPFDVLPPFRALGLVNSMRATADAVSLMLTRLM